MSFVPALCCLRAKIHPQSDIYTATLSNESIRHKGVVKAGTVGNVRVIDYAFRPTWPIRSSRTRIMLLHLIFGGLIGVALAFARNLTSTDRKVLLVDGDLRRGRLHEYLGIERKNGLSEFISGDIPIGEALHQTSVPGLTVVPTGILPPNPTEWLVAR